VTLKLAETPRVDRQSRSLFLWSKWLGDLRRRHGWMLYRITRSFAL